MDNIQLEQCLCNMQVILVSYLFLVSYISAIIFFIKILNLFLFIYFQVSC